MAENREESLAWDYTGENTPLLGASEERQPVFYSDGNRDQSWGLTNRQTEFLLRNLEDAAHLLKVLKHSSPYDQEDKVPTETASDTVTWCRRCTCVVRDCALLWVVTLQLLQFVILTALDSVLKAGEEGSSKELEIALVAIFQGISLVLLIWPTALFWKQWLELQPTMWLVTQVHIGVTFVFCGVYLLTAMCNSKTWPELSGSESFPVLYVHMLHTSVSISTLAGSSAITHVWYIDLLIILQMVLVFIIIISWLACVAGVMSSSLAIRAVPAHQDRQTNNSLSHSSPRVSITNSLDLLFTRDAMSAES